MTTHTQIILPQCGWRVAVRVGMAETATIRNECITQDLRVLAGQASGYENSLSLWHRHEQQENSADEKSSVQR
ncbi:MAG: hypothetical protein AB8B50_16845 [Pirellulaceae bacterium]